MPLTPILQLPYPLLADSPDVPRDVRALALAIESKQLGWNVGDFKASFQTADHPGFVLCDGVPRDRDDVSAAYAALIDAVLTPHPDPTKVRTPNARRRSLMGADPGGASLGGVVPNLGTMGGEERHMLATGELPLSALLTAGSGQHFYGSFAESSSGSFANLERPEAPAAHNNIGPYLAVNIFIATGGAGSGAGGGGGIAPREDVAIVTANLAAAASESGVVSLGARFGLIRFSVDHPSRIRLYTRPDKRDADVGRPYSTPPIDYPTVDSNPNHGVIVDIQLGPGNLEAGFYIQDLAPNRDGSSNENPPSSDIAYRVTNNDAVARIISTTITHQKLEA